jgi:tetratricopeptide (TPR) repeat protein
MFYYLNTWEAKRNDARPYLERLAAGNPLNDTAKKFLTFSLFDLARVHEQLENRDSAKMYYEMCAKLAPESDTTTARYLFNYSRIKADTSFNYSENNQVTNIKMSDSLLELIVERYPRTEYGKEAMLKLGYTDRFVIDTVADLYFSGNSLRSNKEYQFALNQYFKVFEKYPQSKFAPKSLYAIGLMYEKNLNNKDSALHYYELLIKTYPWSDQAKELKLPVAYLIALKSGKPLPDSLKDRAKVEFRPSVDPYEETMKLQSQKGAWEAEKLRRDTEINMENVLKDPSLLFKKAKEKVKETINDPTKVIPKFEMPLDPSTLKNKLNIDSLRINEFVKPLLTDSTKTIQEKKTK